MVSPNSLDQRQEILRRSTDYCALSLEPYGAFEQCRMFGHVGNQLVIGLAAGQREFAKGAVAASQNIFRTHAEL